MNRAEFMEKLRALLADVEDGEREEALNYYEDYFDDAGIENEQQVIESLESPEKVAKIIKEGLSDSEGEQGEFSETGFSGYGDRDKEEVGYHGVSEKGKISDRIKGLGTAGIVLILILAIFALPILGPVIIGIVSAVFGILIAVAAVLFTVAIIGIALVCAGAATFVAGFPAVLVSPAVGILLFGLALLFVGIGILLTILGIWVVWKLVPPMIRWIVRKIQNIFAKRRNSL